ncbi:unnamed protein product [Miscanthus lutarioriparius]|uniref:Uncharacterized protein n=1 Tax=Miscanthus lutarioriparius TaxID=422564 RepID=A0A811QDM5_9POAL|nr:unnamed protein product [Miscanthus lutarioriparius]
MACSKKTLAIVIVPLLMALLASAVPASQGSRALVDGLASLAWSSPPNQCGLVATFGTASTAR